MQQQEPIPPAKLKQKAKPHILGSAMVSMVKAWVQRNRKPLIIVAALVVAVVLIYTVVRFYGTGFDGYKKISTSHIIVGPPSRSVTTTQDNQPAQHLWT